MAKLKSVPTPSPTDAPLELLVCGPNALGIVEPVRPYIGAIETRKSEDATTPSDKERIPQKTEQVITVPAQGPGTHEDS